MMLQASKTPVLIANPRAESEATHLIIEQNETTNTTDLIAEVEVKSQEQPHISLGNYTATNPPGGFAIHIDPDPESDEIITQITRLGTEQEYELVLHIANYGDRPVSIQVGRTA